MMEKRIFVVFQGKLREDLEFKSQFSFIPDCGVQEW